MSGLCQASRHHRPRRAGPHHDVVEGLAGRGNGVEVLGTEVVEVVGYVDDEGEECAAEGEGREGQVRKQHHAALYFTVFTPTADGLHGALGGGATVKVTRYDLLLIHLALT